MQYLITGITGFAAPHLANLLISQGHKVYGLTRRTNGMMSDILDVVPPENYEKITFLYGDLVDYGSLEKIFKEYQFDGIFHLAAMSHPPTSFDHPLHTFETNITGSANLIQLTEKYQKDCHFGFISTSEVYGNSGLNRLLKEDDLLAPSNPYGVSKAAIDLYMQERIVNGKIKGFVTRAFSHTGSRRGRNFSISSDAYQIARIMRGIQEPILEVGNLETTRVVISVIDTVNAYALLMEKRTSGIFNICGDTPRKMEFFTDYLIKLSGLPIEKKVSEKYYRPIDIAYQHGDSTKVKELGWKCEIPIEETLNDLLNYWKNKTSLSKK